MKKFNLLKINKPQEIYDDIIYLTRDDLDNAEKNKKAYEIKAWDFKPSSLSYEKYSKAKMIVFTEKFSVFILKNRFVNNGEVHSKNIELKREDLLPEFHDIPVVDMELYHFNPLIINDIIRYADNVIYKDVFNGYSELHTLKYTR